MTLTKNQQVLYTAVTDIDEKFVEEALCFKKKIVPTAVKRFAAMAAMLLLIITGYIFYAEKLCDNPVTVAVYAAENGKMKITYEADTVEPYHYFFEINKDSTYKRLFSIKIKASGFNPEEMSNVYTVVEYDGNQITSDTQIDQLDICFARNAEERSRFSLCTVNGWTDDEIKFTISVYSKTDETATMLHQQQFTVNYDGSYSVNGSSIEPYVEPKYYFMTTEQIISEVINNNTGVFLFSNPTYAKNYFYRHNQQQISVLRTRANAGPTMLNKLQKLSQMSAEEFDKDFVANGQQWSALIHLLSLDCFLEQLSDTEFAELQKIMVDRFS